MSEKQNVVNMVAAAQVSANADNTWENLVSITEEDLAELGVEARRKRGVSRFSTSSARASTPSSAAEGDGQLCAHGGLPQGS